VVTAFATAAVIVQGAIADRAAYPHEFKQNNMGYCAPYLAQLELPNGERVRPFLNHLLQDLTAMGFEGQKNLGDFYSDKARSETDEQCIDRTGGTA
jgi:hypothetical protein